MGLSGPIAALNDVIRLVHNAINVSANSAKPWICFPSLRVSFNPR
jgi:hypothetical protein